MVLLFMFSFFFFFFFNDTATTEIYTLSLHDALPICEHGVFLAGPVNPHIGDRLELGDPRHVRRSEEHTSELQSRSDLVCRLLLEKKKKKFPRLMFFREIKMNQISTFFSHEV